MTTGASESLQTIPFSNLIGGPLCAAVQAQAQAAQTCIEFIEQVAFVPKDGGGFEQDVRLVDFKYKKTAQDGTEQLFMLSVPILAIVPIPYIRIDEVLIDFNAKITEQTSHEESSTIDTQWTAGGGARWGWGRVNFSCNQTRKSESASKASTSQEYNMSVKVRAVQAEVPGGMQKILEILEKAVRDRPTS